VSSSHLVGPCTLKIPESSPAHQATEYTWCKLVGLKRSHTRATRVRSPTFLVPQSTSDEFRRRAVICALVAKCEGPFAPADPGARDMPSGYMSLNISKCAAGYLRSATPREYRQVHLCRISSDKAHVRAASLIPRLATIWANRVPQPAGTKAACPLLSFLLVVRSPRCTGGPVSEDRRHEVLKALQPRQSKN
jgi:hypothetical protein